MKGKIKFYVMLVLIVFFTGWSIHTAENQKTDILSQPERITGNVLKPDLDFGKIPLYFIQNKGQVNPKALYYAKAMGYTLWLTEEGLVFDRAGEINSKLYREISKLVFLEANKKPIMTAYDCTKLKVNYFKGNDPTRWQSDLPTFKTVRYEGLYPNIDLKVYGIEKEVEYDWVIKSGGNPDAIVFKYQNIKRSRINGKGELMVKTGFGKFSHKKPIVYQMISGKKRMVRADYRKVGKNTYGFRVGKYDQNRDLIIDPVIKLHYSTYLGGSSGEYARGIAVNEKGWAYTVGNTYSADFPTQYQYQNYQGSSDVFVACIDTNKSGFSSMVFSTFLGGNSTDVGFGIAVDKSKGDILITGLTMSSNFPASGHAFQNSCQGDQDAFLTCLSQTGAFKYSTYLGGTGGDCGYGVCGTSWDPIVAGRTDSTDFPIHKGYQSSYQGGSADAFITCFDGVDELEFSTYLGGSARDQANAVIMDDTGFILITGYTESSNYPVCHDCYKDYNSGGGDAFLTWFYLDGTFKYSTYLGGSGRDYGMGVGGNQWDPVVVGYTNSKDFPTSHNALQKTFQGGNWDAFVIHLDWYDHGVYLTYLGGKGDDIAYGVDTLDREVWVCGATSSTNFPIKDAYQNSCQGDRDAFITKLKLWESGHESLIYSTYLGGDYYDRGYGIAVDSKGHAYVTGSTKSAGFPIKNQYQLYEHNTDAFVTRLALECTVKAQVSGGHGEVQPKSQSLFEGEDATVNIFPDSGYKIQSIDDNGEFKGIKNPYIIEEVGEDHDVIVTFGPEVYPPTLDLTAKRKTQSAWIIKKEYGDIHITITEHESKPMAVAKYILYKKTVSSWVEIKSFSTAGTYQYNDQYLKANEKYKYQVVAVNKKGILVASSDVVTI